MARAFVKHKVYGTLYAVDFAEDGAAIAAAEVSEAVACRHRLPLYDLGLDAGEHLTAHLRDFEQCEPVCTDATHLLTDITEASHACDDAEQAYERAKTHARRLKEALDEKQQALRSLVRDAGRTRPLPLFDQAGV